MGKWQTHSRHHKREPNGQPFPSRWPQGTYVLQCAPREHSAIPATCIKLPAVFNTFVFSYFEWPIKTGLMYTKLVNHGLEEVSTLRKALIFQHDILSIDPFKTRNLGEQLWPRWYASQWGISSEYSMIASKSIFREKIQYYLENYNMLPLNICNDKSWLYCI